MSKLEELTPNAAVRGILLDALATVVSIQWFGSEALELTYKTPSGKVANELMYRHDEPRLEVVEQGRRGVSTAMGGFSAWCRRHTASAWRISSIPCLPCILPFWSPCRTRSPPFTR